MKTTSELLKEIRLSKKLTQKQFAKKFFITEKTISNYENGVRTPDLDFLNKVCEEFNITLDYFMEKSKNESNPQDLILSEKNGKYAIYDKKQSVYLTGHLYDAIMLSESGNHIVYNTKDVIVDGKVYKNNKITYSAICNNFGNIKEFPNLEFGFNGGFGLFDVCPAFNKKTKKIHLVNNKGEVLSKGYIRIHQIGAESGINLGLYFGLKYNFVNEEVKVETRDLLYLDGTNIDVNFEDINDNLSPKVKEFKNLDVVIDYIKKYGPNILMLTPNNIFKESENYYKIILAVNEYAKNSKYYRLMLNYAIGCLYEYAEALKPKAKIKLDKELIFPQEISVKNKVEKNVISKSISILYDKIGLI
ncbi:MAG: helix-turn-helix transcriptional regulator [Clostridiales bacterium]|nr:helix-turn-helix transcriptional regulator [Clostridiales bacterium]